MSMDEPSSQHRFSGESSISFEPESDDMNLSFESDAGQYSHSQGAAYSQPSFDDSLELDDDNFLGGLPDLDDCSTPLDSGASSQATCFSLTDGLCNLADNQVNDDLDCDILFDADDGMYLLPSSPPLLVELGKWTEPELTLSYADETMPFDDDDELCTGEDDDWMSGRQGRVCF